MPQPPITDNATSLTDQIWSNHNGDWLRADGPAYVVPRMPASRPVVTTDMYWYNAYGRMVRSVHLGTIQGNN